MFRVPSSAEAPSFDQTFKVGFWQWMKSSGADRREWRRRQNVARKAWNRAKLDGINQRHDTRRAELREQEAEIKAQIAEKLGRRPRRRR